MDQRGGGGCCIASYAGGAYDMSKMDRIMLKFRPIAPKPAAAGNASLSGGSPENSCPSVVKSGRGKRKGACNKNNNSSSSSGSNSSVTKKRSCRCSSSIRKGSKSSPENNTGEAEAVVKTLPLLPEVPDVKMAERNLSKRCRFPLLLSFENGGKAVEQDRTTVVGPRVAVGSSVKVERVTDTWVVDCYGYGWIGRTDEEKVRSLDGDACPGFVSDGLNKVRWTNAAYRRMVGGGDVVVVVEEGVALPVGCAGFTCRVRVVTCGGKGNCKTVPCDVWRMDCGGFAWRLDTAAALSLSFGP